MADGLDADAMLTDQILARLDKLDTKMDSLVSRSEFQTLAAKVDNSIPRPEYDKAYEASNARLLRIENALDRSVEKQETMVSKEDHNKVAAQVEAIQKNQAPPWLISSISGVIVAVGSGVILWLISHAPSAQAIATAHP